MSVGYSVTFWPFGVSGYIYQTKKMMGIWHVSCWWTFYIKFLRGKVHFSDHAYHRDCLCCTKYWKEFVMLLLLQLFTGPAYSGKFLIEIIQIQIILIERRFFKSMAETWKHVSISTCTAFHLNQKKKKIKWKDSFIYIVYACVYVEHRRYFVSGLFLKDFRWSLLLSSIA